MFAEHEAEQRELKVKNLMRTPWITIKNFLSFHYSVTGTIYCYHACSHRDLGAI